MLLRNISPVKSQMLTYDIWKCIFTSCIRQLCYITNCPRFQWLKPQLFILVHTSADKLKASWPRPCIDSSCMMSWTWLFTANSLCPGLLWKVGLLDPRCSEKALCMGVVAEEEDGKPITWAHPWITATNIPLSKAHHMAKPNIDREGKYSPYT